MKANPHTILAACSLLAGLFLTSCFADETAGTTKKPQDAVNKAEPKKKREGLEVIGLGAGCFWCIEAVLEQLEGVEDVVSGYMGGKVKNPTYRQICTGQTGHAEIVQVHFDPKVIPLKTSLSYFWKLHDPTTLNRQGADVGTQYRSVIFYHTDEQKALAESQKKTVDESKVFEDPIVTEISKAETFYEAEEYHQDYYRLNKNDPNGNIRYCRAVISPKLDKLGLEK